MENTKVIYAVNSDLSDDLFYAEFDTKDEAMQYAKAHMDRLPFVDEIELEIDEEGFENALSYKTIWAHNNYTFAESVTFATKAEQEEFFRLCKECGFNTLKDLEKFKLDAGVEDADLIQALRDYRDSLNAFDVFDDEVECQSCGNVFLAKHGRRTDGGYYVCNHCIEEDFDALVETLEANEDVVECKECFELFPKADCIKIEFGYICPTCGKSVCADEVHSDPEFTVADEDVFKVDFPEVERFSEVQPDPVMVDADTADVAPVEAPVTKEETITKLVIDEQEAIAGYEKAKIEIEANPELDEKEKEEILDTIEHIKEEEVEHIEELTELLDGEEEKVPEDPEDEDVKEDTEETPEEEVEEIEDPEAEPVEEAMSDFQRGLIEKLPKMTKEEFKTMLESGDTVKIFYGDPREPGVRSRDYEVTLVDGTYEVTYWEETYNDDFTDSELAEEFDNIDDLWDFMVNFMEDDDFSPEYNYVAEALTEHVNEEHPAIESDQELGGIDNAVVDCKVAKVITHSEDEKPVDCEGKKKPLEKPLAEETHAQFAKPEGNRVQAYNNALKYAKQYNADFIYGYTNHAGKFFALEQPIKATDLIEAEKEFKNKYKNCKVIYVAYPDKAFIKESLYNFTPEEIEEFGMDEDGNSLEGYDTFVRCNWCQEVFTESDCKFEANLGWLCDRCQEEIRSHGGPLTIVEEPTEEQIKATLEEAVKMTRDELMDKEGTDDVELINAGRSEEERVELVEANINIKTLGTEIFDSGEAAMYVAREMTYDLVGEPKDAVKLAKWGDNVVDLIDDEPLILGDLIRAALVAGNWHYEAESYGWDRLPVNWSSFVDRTEKAQMDKYIKACRSRQDKLHLLFLAINNLALEWAGREGWYN